MQSKSYTYVAQILSMCLLCAGVALYAVHVQAEQFGAIEAGTVLHILPENPSPGETVRAVLTTVKTDVHSAMVTWVLNDKVVYQGRGADTYEFVVGANGSKVTLTASVTPDVGDKVATGVSFVVSNVAVVWEARTYTPPFYKGRSLQSPNASVAFLALPNIQDPNGTVYDPATLSYDWYVDADPNPTLSGYGLQSVVLTNPNPFSSLRVTLKIRDKTGTQRALKNLDVPVVTPEIVFYQDNPLLGIRYDSALGEMYHMNSQELVLVAEPYYTSVSDRYDDALTYTWKVGSQEMNNKGAITLRPEGAGAGSARINLEIMPNPFWEQYTKGQTVVSFDANTSQRTTL